jgi:hypothetical protein
MSMDIHVCWRGAFAPSRAALQGALKEVGFEATVLHDFPGDGGFWPIDIGEFKTGVEADADDDLDELVEDYPVLAAALDGRDRGVTFTFGGDPAEAGTALALAAAIAHLCGAVVYEPSEGVTYSTSRAAAEARDSFEMAKKEGYRQRED